MSATQHRDIVAGFRKQADDDAESSLCLFEKKHYGNSAYLCQQSIEKTIKAVMIEYKLTTKNAKGLRHLPLAEIWRIMSLEAKELASTAKDEKSRKTYERMQDLIDIGERIFKESTGSAKIVWWKVSLQIPLTKPEIDEFNKFVRDFIKSIGQMKNGLDNLVRLADSKYAKSRVHKRARNVLKGSSGELAEYLDEVEQTGGIKNASEDLKRVEPILNGLLRASSSIVQQQEQTSPFTYYSTRMLIWSVEFVMPILMITPHEDIGRYPLRIGPRRSDAWYVKKQAELKYLEEIIKEARDELIARMRPKSRVHYKRLRLVWGQK